MQRLCITSEERWAELELLGAMAASARGVAILLPRVRGVVCQRQRADAEPGEFIWMVENLSVEMRDCALPLCDVVVATGGVGQQRRVPVLPRTVPQGSAVMIGTSLVCTARGGHTGLCM